MVDTNSDPRQVDYLIPSNDDASKSIDKIVGYVSDAVIEGLAERKAGKEAQAEGKDKPAPKAKAKPAPAAKKAPAEKAAPAPEVKAEPAKVEAAASEEEE